MAIITDVWFSHEHGALAGTLDALPALDVSVIREVSTDPQRNVYFFRFDGPPIGDVREALESDRSVRAIEELSAFEQQRLLGVEFDERANLLAPEVTGAGGYVIDARGKRGRSRPPGWFERWSLPEHSSLSTIWEDARRDGFDFEIIALHRHGGSDDTSFRSDRLTAQQRMALVTAYESGYYAEPRRTSQAELAAQIGVSPSAVSGRIKRGMKSLIETTIETERIDHR